MARTKQTSRRSTGGRDKRLVEFSVFLYDYSTLNQEQSQVIVDVESDNCLWVGYQVVDDTMKEGDIIHSLIEKYELVSSHIAKFDMMNDKSFARIEELFSLHNNEDTNMESMLLSKLYDNVEPNLDEKFEKEHFPNTILQDGLFDEIVSYLDPLSMARLSLTSKEFLYERIFKEEITKNGTANKPRFTIPPLAVVVIPLEVSHQELNYLSEEENSDQEESEEETSPKKKTKFE